MISAIIHTYNEEENIDRCLNSLGFADELIVIDMGSTDKTLKIAREHKATVFNHPYTHFVEPARNFGISKAKNEWILIVDADEEIPKTLSNFLVQAAQDKSFDYYRIPRKNIIFGRVIKYSGWWPDYQIRFFRKGKVRWVEKIHGIPMTTGSGTDVEPFEQFSIIHHHYNSIEQYILRLNRYTSISAKERFLANQKFSISRLFSAPTGEFIKRYYVENGYKDGLHGLALSILQSFYEVVIVLKLWELESFPQEKVTLPEIHKQTVLQIKENQFWMYHELLKMHPSFLKRVLFKLKRTLHIYD